MITNWLKKNRKQIIFILTIALFLAMGSVVYRLFGHRLLANIYEIIEDNKLFFEKQETVTLEHYLEKADRLFFRKVIPISFFLIIFAKFFLSILHRAGRRLEAHTDTIDALPGSEIAFWIALAAGLTLFAELMFIRIHSCYSELFGYYKNVSLLSCFLGLGIGYARGSQRPLLTPFVLPLMAAQIIVLYAFRLRPIWAHWTANPVVEQVGFGLAQATAIKHYISAYSLITLTFAFNALCFIPLGQLTSRLMMRKPKLVAYSWNLIGSLAGIVLFSVISFMWTPPYIWIILVAITLITFLHKDIINLLPSFLALIIVLLFLAVPFRLNQVDIYSPYQLITRTTFPTTSTYNPESLSSNNKWHTAIEDLSQTKQSYDATSREHAETVEIAYNFKPKPKDVLIVGSGTGPDVAAAIRRGAGEIDAVEIDPVIMEFGRQLHPERPYQAANVNTIVNDARAYIRHTDKRYDLIIYGALDSHSLLSGKAGGVRLDSYVYTVEAFQEARQKLKDEGIICLRFAIINPALGRKLFLMLQEAFNGEKPIVFDNGSGFLAGEDIRERFLDHPSLAGKITYHFDDDRFKADKATDDWPFFYMPKRKYPISYVAVILTLLAISVIFIRGFVPRTGRGGGFSVPCFFLGAGFMLVETKAITELALVYGSTWIVISIVIVAILIMAFFANLLVMRIGHPATLITYGLLFISLIFGLGLTFADLGKLSPWLGRILITTTVTLPIFFSGFAFSSELKKSVSVAVALSSNLLGAIVGGFLEYNSMYFGFRALYILALILYIFAFLGSVKGRTYNYKNLKVGQTSFL